MKKIEEKRSSSNFCPLGLIVCYLAQQRMVFRVSLCGCCKPNAFISKEVKVILIGDLPGTPNCQVMLCELDGSGAFLAAKHLKLGVPYTWNDLWSTTGPRAEEKCWCVSDWPVASVITFIFYYQRLCVFVYNVKAGTTRVVISNPFINTKPREKGEDVRRSWEEHWWSRGCRWGLSGGPALPGHPSTGESKIK